jgi:glycosyltransferase involved in cell wall biosynthesis
MNVAKKLWIIVPVYNEEASIIHVIEEWLPEIRKNVGKDQFVFCTLNDGSKDKTRAILHAQEKKYAEIRVIDKENTGHGQTCVFGYREALKNNAEWIFQIDSDGQCDPVFFKLFWDERDKHKVIYGYRKRREDGLSRFLISRVVALVVFLATGIFVKDANVPYRMMHSSTLRDAIECIPEDFKLTNILMAVMQKRRCNIKWINIIFRDRYGGSPSVTAYSFISEGVKLRKQLQTLKNIL